MAVYSGITDKEFDALLVTILEGMTAAELLSLEGVYEIVAEYYNNEILDMWEAKQDGE
jgi:hypothetical protein